MMTANLDRCFSFVHGQTAPAAKAAAPVAVRRAVTISRQAGGGGLRVAEKLAELGNVILIGRAGNVVTAKLPHVLHVRLVAPLEERIERLCRDDHKTPAEARKFCLEEEQSRARYLKTYFHADINDPLQYHLVINTSLVGYDHAAQLIGDAVLRLGA